MTRRKKLFILIGALIIVLLIAAWLAYRFLNQPEPAPEPVEQPQAEEQEAPEEESDEPTLSEQLQEEEQEERNQTTGLRSATQTFVQRYGSYSTEANFANLEDVIPLMTDGFAQETQRFIDENEPSEEYYGVTTRVVSIDIVERDEGAGVATVRATTQREESTGSPQNTSISYQDIVVDYEQVDGVWKVSDATWQ
jgi:cytoskeletal protein RodZ